MILYDHPLSSYCQKVKIALREKGLKFDRVLPEDFGTGRRDTAFAAATPAPKCPRSCRTTASRSSIRP